MTLYQMILLSLIYLVGILEMANYFKEPMDDSDQRRVQMLCSVVWPLTIWVLVICHSYYGIKYIIKDWKEWGK